MLIQTNFYLTSSTFQVDFIQAAIKIENKNCKLLMAIIEFKNIHLLMQSTIKLFKFVSSIAKTISLSYLSDPVVMYRSYFLDTL